MWLWPRSLPSLPAPRPAVLLQGAAFRAISSSLLKAHQEASECCLIFGDFKEAGFDRIVINPRVKVRVAAPLRSAWPVPCSLTRVWGNAERAIPGRLQVAVLLHVQVPDAAAAACILDV